MITFILGLWLGVLAGYFLCALMVIAKEADNGNSITVHGMTDDGPLTVSKPSVDSVGDGE